MEHQMIILSIVFACLFFALIYIIKNKPQYLVLLGIRGFLSMFFIQFINYLCETANLATIIQVNPLSLLSGAFLGIPGILLMYISKIYLL